MEREEFFYCSREKRALYIPPYYVDGTGMLDTIIKNMQEERANFVKMLGGEPKGTIYTREIQESTRYKHMRCFYVDCETAPKGAFILGDDWTINQWIRG